VVGLGVYVVSVKWFFEVNLRVTVSPPARLAGVVDVSSERRSPDVTSKLLRVVTTAAAAAAA